MFFSLKIDVQIERQDKMISQRTQRCVCLQSHDSIPANEDTAVKNVSYYFHWRRQNIRFQSVFEFVKWHLLILIFNMKIWY